MTRINVLIAATAAVLFVLSPTSASAGATAYVVHGIPGGDLGIDDNSLPVDVSINDACALPNFAFGEIVGPVGLDAGTYDIEISLADAEYPCSNDPVISAPGIELADDEHYSIVAHLDADGAPTASVFVNNLETRYNRARLNLFHTAAAPSVDVTLKRSLWPRWFRGIRIHDFMNGDNVDTQLYRGSWYASLAPAGSRDAVFGPVELSVEGETTYLVYAVGSIATGSFTLLASTAEYAEFDEEPNATAYVVHGIPGADIGADMALPVDVSVGGACALPGFEFGNIVGPIELGGGEYDIAISLANADEPCSNDSVISATVELEAGTSYSIVAHLSDDGSPTASVFENDLHAGRYKAAVNVFHTANAPRVDVSLKYRWYYWWFRALTVSDLGNGENASAEVYRGTYSASIYPAGSRDRVFGPATLQLEGSTAYFVYAVGSLTNGTFTLLIESAPAQD